MTKEIDGYLAILDDLRGQVKKGLEGLDREALDWRPIPEEGDLHQLPGGHRHPSCRFGNILDERDHRRTAHPPRPRGRVRGQGGRRIGTASKAGGSGPGYQSGLASLPPSRLDEERKFRDRKVTVRWAILHVIEHTATHLGHIQLTRQLWESQEKRFSP